MNTKIYISLIVIVLLCAAAIAAPAYCQDDNTRNVLKQGLLGAGTGAIAAGASGGNAGQGALIGAGTNVIGGALLDAISGPSSSSSSRRSAPQDEYYDDQRGEYYYEEPAPQQSGTSQVLKQGLLGAGTGAIASSMSGGNAGKGALIGAGTNIIGGALLDAISQPAQPKRVYRRAPAPQQQYQQPYQQQQQYQPQYQQPQQVVVQPQNVEVKEESTGSGEGRKKVIKKYDANGKLVSEEEIYY
jgi:hypothetical protein